MSKWGASDREPKSLGQVFNFKLDSFGSVNDATIIIKLIIFEIRAALYFKNIILKKGLT